ncbi:hypothetical protein PIROE2DRAFT_14139 [Piromyces sp. E2]|nr:hypothetical protein PIROE2DRAFT_14139 [Piromyces sp. E2]|eukprot:OUM60148.1 hypothetical protein PIROE2DRAFT_14139 [Piromyces sp. E2]
MYDGWYDLSVTAKKSTSSLGFTIYGSSLKEKDVIVIKNIKINGKKISFSTDDWSEWEQPKLSFSLTNDPSSSPSPSNTKPSSSSNVSESSTTIKNIGMINAGPGTDCSKEMTIAWHSPYLNNYVEYTVASDSNFRNSKRVDVTCSFIDSDREFINDKLKPVEFYACKAYLTDLSSNTDYIYRVGNEYNGNSSSKKFKTAAGGKNNFSFAWLADVHTVNDSAQYRENIKSLINTMGNINFVMFSGDITKIGNMYDQWGYFAGNPSVSNYMFATIAGNHDYYKTTDGKNKLAVGKCKYYSNKWYLDYAAIPISSTYRDSNYWFIYNNVLFFNIDSTQNDDVNEKDVKVDVDDQIKWFKNVVKSLKGKYDYIIVQQHFSYIIDTTVKYGKFKKWSPVFREFKVDLALGADTHTYSRSAPLYYTGNKSKPKYISKSNVQMSSSEGTVYMTSYQLDGLDDHGKLYLAKKVVNNASLFKNDSFSAGGGNGGCKIDVTSEGIKLVLYTGNGKSDSVFISKKSR